MSKQKPADYRNAPHKGARQPLDPAVLTNRLTGVALLIEDGYIADAQDALRKIINEVGQSIVVPPKPSAKSAPQINAVTGLPRRPMEEILEPDDWLTDDNIEKMQLFDDAPYLSHILPFRELCELIRMEVLHTFYNCYRGRTTRKELVEESQSCNFDDTLELDLERFFERRNAPWIFYPLRQYA